MKKLSTTLTPSFAKSTDLPTNLAPLVKTILASPTTVRWLSWIQPTMEKGHGSGCCRRWD